MYLWRWDFSMRRKGKLSTKQKVDICKQYLNGEKSASELSHDFDISDITIRRWSKKYQSLGSGCFNIKPHNAKYTKEFKQQVVEAYLAGEGSLLDIAIRYEIPSDATVNNWIRKYNTLEELKDYDPKPGVYMKDHSRKTSQEERIKIVNYCLEHNKNYKKPQKNLIFHTCKYINGSKNIWHLEKKVSLIVVDNTRQKNN